MKVVKQGNCFIQAVSDALRGGAKIYILGGGSGARNLYQLLCKTLARKIPLEAFLVNDVYYEKIPYKEMLGIPVLPLSSMDEKTNRVLLLLGYGHYLYYSNKLLIPNFVGNFIDEDPFFHFDKTGDGKYLDYEYYERHIQEFEEIANIWEDEKSRKIMEAYINQKISGKLSYLQNLWDQNQYFDENVVNIKSVSCFVDGGAYDGDTYRSFLNHYQRLTGGEFYGTAYLWEPEEINYKKICTWYEDDRHVILKQLGMWNKKDVLKFSGHDASGQIAECGEQIIFVDKIDSVIHEHVDFIKMDIEGAEYNGLLGAERIIKRDHPILAVCAYHKRDDLIRLPRLIRSLNPNYKLYLRIYTPYVQELVIYAV